MDEKFIIRNAEIKDIPNLVAFRIKLQRHMENVNILFPRYKDGWESRSHKLYKEKITESDSLVLVAVTNKNEVIAMALASEQNHKEFIIGKSIKIDDVWVEPKYRRKNICKRLLTRITEHYEGINLFSLNYVEGNVEAEKTWKHLGFKPAIHFCVNYLDRNFGEG